MTSTWKLSQLGRAGGGKQRKHLPIKHVDMIYTARAFPAVIREYDTILAAQTPDDIDTSYEELIA
jgi:hypothetical protein